MLVTLSGIVTLVKLLHSPNAYEPMLVTLSGIVYVVAVFPVGEVLAGDTRHDAHEGLCALDGLDGVLPFGSDELENLRFDAKEGTNT